MATPDNPDTRAATEFHIVPETITVGAREVDTTLLFRVIGLGWLTLVGWQITGVLGVAIGVALAAVAVVARPVITVALAHAGLLVLVPDLTGVDSLIQIGLFELGLLGVLLSEPPLAAPTALLTVAFGLTFVGTTIAVQIWAGQLAASLVLLGLVSILAYGIHRYEQVSLGLVTADHDTEHYE